MSAPLLDPETAARARDILQTADYESSSPFEWAVVRLLALIVDAITRRDR